MVLAEEQRNPSRPSMKGEGDSSAVELPPTNVLGSAKTLWSYCSVYGRRRHHAGHADGHGGIVVVAPMGTKPLLGGSKSSVPAGTLSGFFMLFNSTKAGAERLNRSAMR